ncbi:MAG: NAD(P)-dependent oxidoreductase, partial [Alphaproteobacteria bacterium]
MSEGALKGQKIGFIGLGLMGKPMSRRLKAAGAEVTVYNRTRAVADELAQDGMRVAASPKHVAAASDITIVCVLDTPACEAVMRGADGVFAGIKEGALVIDMGTTQVTNTRALATEARALGAEYLDAPVSGGQVGAEAGTLSIMVGGSAAAFARAKPAFEAMGQRVTLVGDVGAGQVAKTANQVIVGLTIGAVAEALTLAQRAGVDPGKVREALMGGFATSRILELHGKRMVDGNFTPGGKAT